LAVELVPGSHVYGLTAKNDGLFNIDLLLLNLGRWSHFLVKGVGLRSLVIPELSLLMLLFSHFFMRGSHTGRRGSLVVEALHGLRSSFNLLRSLVIPELSLLMLRFLHLFMK
jgi:hypothetical protein